MGKMRNINRQASVWSLSAISSFSSGGGVSGPQNRSVSQVANIISSHEISVATTSNLGQPGSLGLADWR